MTASTAPRGTAALKAAARNNGPDATFFKCRQMLPSDGFDYATGSGGRKARRFNIE
jgi:hypothetical protein